MARRMKSYRANKGKEVEVWLNNMAVQGAKNRKAREKREAAASRARARQADADRKRRERERIKEEKRQEREREKRRREQEKQQEKYNKMYDRLSLEFEKSDLVLTDSIADKIITKAMKTSVTVAQLRKYFIEGEENQLWHDALLELFQDHFASEYPTIKPKHYTEGGDFAEEVEGVWDHLLAAREELGYTTFSDCKKDSKWKTLNKKLAERESFLQSRILENEKIDAFMQKLVKGLKLLPDDVEILSEKIDADDGMSLTVDELERSIEYQTGITRKKELVEKVDRKYELLKA